MSHINLTASCKHRSSSPGLLLSDHLKFMQNLEISLYNCILSVGLKLLYNIISTLDNLEY